jgi:CheY-like chemotaxis protein
VLSVHDTGIGIQPELLPHVFDRFRQGEVGFTRQHRGLGLGLAIVRHLVERHGGRVRAQSDGLGQGATFTVELPIMPVQLPLLRPDAQRPGGVGVAAPLAGVRLLVVEDDPDSCQMIAAALREAGAEVTAVTAASDAVRALANRGRFDALVTDLGLPETDGYALLRSVRREEGDADGHLPAIAVTGFATPEDRDRALASGFQAHLAKPIDPGDLVDAVAKAVKKTAGSADRT